MATTCDPTNTAKEWGIPLSDPVTALAKTRHWRQYVEPDIASPKRPGTYLAARIADLTQFVTDLMALEAHIEATAATAAPLPLAA